VLLKAARSWLHHAGIEDHLRGEATLPKIQVPVVIFETVTEWLVLLTQLVLKIEWTVTSVGRERVNDQAKSLWDQICAYEERFNVEIELVAPQALILRRSQASTLT
jgi:hypothetical protein